MTEIKLVPYISDATNLSDYRVERLIEKYKSFSSRVEKGLLDKDVLHGFETVLTIIGYDVEGSDGQA